MKFVIIGLRMARRSFARSLLAVLSIAIATVTLIAAGHLALGRPGDAAVTARQFIGGDILVLAESMAVDDAALRPDPHWVYHRHDLDTEHLLAELRPSSFTVGNMVDERRRLDDLASLVPSITEVDGVTGVYPVYTMPVLIHRDGQLIPTSVRARLVEKDLRSGLDVLITRGHYLSGRPGEAVVESWVPHTVYAGRREFAYDRFDGQRIFLTMGQPVISDASVPTPGEAINLEIPTFNGGWDYSNRVDYALSVIGNLELPTRSVSWNMRVLEIGGLNPATTDPPRDFPSMYPVETRYWTTAQVQVSLDTFNLLAEAAGWDPRPSALAVSVESAALVLDQVEGIRRMIGGGLVVAVAEWFENMHMTPEPLLMVPPGDLFSLRIASGTPRASGFAPPTVVVSLMMWAAYVMGAMLYAGTVYIVLMGRRKELALMKVLGARTRQVVTVVLAEMVSLGAAGAVIGLLVMSPPVLWQLGTAAPTFASFAQTILRLGGGVILTAVVVCGIFGGIPAYLMVTRTAEETLMEGG